MPTQLKIDLVSDVACPWCVIGLYELEIALARVRDEIDVELTFEPFELNPDMPPGGQNIVDYVMSHYGSTVAESVENRKVLRARAASLGFDMPLCDQSRMVNTRDAHRLLHWARTSGHQLELKHRLFEANFTEGRDVSNRQVLANVAEKAGLNGEDAAAILASSRYTGEVVQAERLWRSRGITSVPTVLIGDRLKVSGGQSAEVFEEALRRAAADTEPSYG